jgi:hypothetical protein
MAIAVLRVRLVASDAETCYLRLKYIVDSVMSSESNELSARSWVAIILFYFYIVGFSLTPSIMSPMGGFWTVVKFFVRALDFRGG